MPRQKAARAHMRGTEYSEGGDAPTEKHEGLWSQVVDVVGAVRCLIENNQGIGASRRQRGGCEVWNAFSDCLAQYRKKKLKREEFARTSLLLLENGVDGGMVIMQVSFRAGRNPWAS